jgi:hypothetical protein
MSNELHCSWPAFLMSATCMLTYICQSRDRGCDKWIPNGFKSSLAILSGMHISSVLFLSAIEH